jgi:nucleoid-associated protein YgaU
VTSVFTKRFIAILAGLALCLGFGLAGSLPAQAASTVWDRVAECESSGNWKINTGNGYYGGLQFSPRTWKGFGGKQYASQAHKARKSQQIAIARRVLAIQGPGAWPTCSRRAGLTKKNGGADKNATPSTNPGSSSKLDKPTPKSAASIKTAKAKTTKVRSGDTIRKIAKRYNVAGGWRGLWQLNKKTVTDPNRIYVGQVLRIR